MRIFVVFSQIAWDFLQKGGILNCHETASKDVTREDEIELFNKCVEKSRICLRNVCDGNGNNAIHVWFKKLKREWTKYTRRKLKHKNAKLKLNDEFGGLKKLFGVCNDWLFAVNNENNIPILLLFDNWRMQVTLGQDGNRAQFSSICGIDEILLHDNIIAIILQSFTVLMDLMDEYQCMCFILSIFFA